MLRPFVHPVACCCMLLHVVAQSLKQFKILNQLLPTFLLFRDRRSVAQQCWIRLHSSANIVGATHAHYTWSLKSYGLYPSHGALQVPTLLGVVCTPLTNTVTTTPALMSGEQYWQLLRSFARSLAPVAMAWDLKVHTCEFKMAWYWPSSLLSIYARTETKRCRPIMELTFSLLD